MVTMYCYWLHCKDFFFLTSNEIFYKNSASDLQPTAFCSKARVSSLFQKEQQLLIEKTMKNYEVSNITARIHLLLITTASTHIQKIVHMCETLFRQSINNTLPTQCLLCFNAWFFILNELAHTLLVNRRMMEAR